MACRLETASWCFAGSATVTGCRLHEAPGPKGGKTYSCARGPAQPGPPTVIQSASLRVMVVAWILGGRHLALKKEQPERDERHDPGQGDGQRSAMPEARESAIQIVGKYGRAAAEA